VAQIGGHHSERDTSRFQVTEGQRHAAGEPCKILEALMDPVGEREGPSLAVTVGRPMQSPKKLRGTSRANLRTRSSTPPIRVTAYQTIRAGSSPPRPSTPQDSGPDSPIRSSTSRNTSTPSAAATPAKAVATNLASGLASRLVRPPIRPGEGPQRHGLRLPGSLRPFEPGLGHPRSVRDIE